MGAPGASSMPWPRPRRCACRWHRGATASTWAWPRPVRAGPPTSCSGTGRRWGRCRRRPEGPAGPAEARARPGPGAWRGGATGLPGSSRTPSGSSRNRAPVHLLYALASYVAFAALLPVLLFHPKRRHGIAQRLGRYRPPLPPAPPGAPRVWLHGASAGDLLSLQPMVKELRARLPGCSIVVTTITNSGQEMAARRITEADVVLYAP